MLVNFRFENFLSYDKLAQFSMTIGNTRRHQKQIMKFKDVSLLKFAALYGANASGKSSFVEAIKFSKNLILKGFSETISFDKFCKINKENEMRTTQFEYEIIINEIVYSYGFSINLLEKIIYSEWLYSLIDNKEIEVFTKNLDMTKNVNIININYDFLKLNAKDKGRLDVYMDDYKVVNDSLILSLLNTNKPLFKSINDISIFHLIYDWFDNKLEVISPNESLTDNAMTYFKKEDGLKLAQFLNAFGTGITEICTKVIHEKDLYKEIPSVIVKKIFENILENESDSTHVLLKTSNNIHQLQRINNHIQIETINFKHSTDNVFYSLNEESDGTIRLVEIYDIFASSSEKVFIVDELDRSLHPNLTYNFIQEYLNKNGQGQLIVTTHEDRLLDLEILRRDEIWFVEKQDDGGSSLYSLEKYKERFDKDILRAYLDGRYGSIPKFKFFN